MVHLLESRILLTDLEAAIVNSADIGVDSASGQTAGAVVIRPATRVENASVWTAAAMVNSEAVRVESASGWTAGAVVIRSATRVENATGWTAADK